MIIRFLHGFSNVFVVATIAFFLTKYFDKELIGEGWLNHIAIFIAIGNGIARVFKCKGNGVDDDDDYWIDYD